jgi:hypothetical protein
MNEILQKINSNNYFPYATENDIVYFENYWFIFKNGVWEAHVKASE